MSRRARPDCGSALPLLKPDHRFAAEAAVAKLFEHLARAAQFNREADARGDLTFDQHASDLVQSFP
jgi:hypothetical protein